MNVYTYYKQVPGLWSDDSQRKLLDVWARSWTKAGWNPVILGEEDAQKHPRYEELKGRYWNLPSPYGHDYDGGCFLRWAAVAAAGGGLMVDYDVINYDFSPRPTSSHHMLVFSNKTPQHSFMGISECVFMGVVLGPQRYYEHMVQEFFNWRSHPIDNEYCSDLTCLTRMFHTDTWPCPGWLHRVPGCALFDNSGWKTAPLVHYAFKMHALGYWPKCDHIEKLRPF